MHHRSLVLLPVLLAWGCGIQNFDEFLVDSGTKEGVRANGDGGGGDGAEVDSGLAGGSDGDAPCPDADADGVDSCSGDCDDADADAFPGAAELDDASACMRDADGDGWGDATVTGDVVPGTDCNDDDPDLDPVDADGDGASPCGGDCNDDDPLTGAGLAWRDDATACMTDADGDGWGASAVVPPVVAGLDCDDTNAARNPDATEVPFDSVDTDCDGEDGGFTTSASGGGGSGYSIYDYETTLSSANVSSCPTVYDVTVALNITHTYIGDLQVILRAPSGAQVVLHDRTGGSTDNISGTYGSSGGTLSAAGSMASFLGGTGSGIWQLSVYDGAGSDQGQISSWSVSLSCL